MSNQFSNDGGRPTAWTRSQAAGLERADRTVAPIIYPAPSDPFDGWHIWDTWPVRTRDGTIAEIDGNRIIVSLTTEDSLLPGKRHDLAELHYFYSRDGRRWTHGGPVFDDGAYGSRQWAGSALYDDGDLNVFYTASGSRGESELTYTQRIAGAEGGHVTASPDGEGITIVGDWRHEVLLEPDGTFYEREDQSRGMIYTFRDPWFFEDPETGETILLFEANTPVQAGSDRCGGDSVQQEFNGSVGMAVSASGDPMDWELRAPLVDAVCVNQELERPHVAYRNGSYYLFVSSHKHTFAPGIEGFDGLYGFVADDLAGPYRPINGHGLVATNPANAPFQAYSWIAYLHREELLVASFFNYYDYVGESLDGIAALPETEQLRRFGGTLAPTLRIQLDGDRTRILGTLDHGHLPFPSEPLPEPRSSWTGQSGAPDVY